jgi:type II restriction enzyme
MKMGFHETQAPYTSGAQNARAWTERWVRDWLYCPNCGHSNISQFTANRPVADFYCTVCSEEYELKSQKRKFGSKILDGAFRTMRQRLESSNNPNLILLNYDLSLLSVTNAFIIPKQFFVREIIQERPPLAATARRAGWIGCNILLDRIPDAGRIFVVRGGHPEPRETVIDLWKRTLFLREQNVASRGWLVEVMKCVDAIGKREFSLREVYQFERHLSSLYPDNRHVRQKIRQQLQVLRDHDYLDFVSRGYYRKRFPEQSK